MMLDKLTDELPEVDMDALRRAMAIAMTHETTRVQLESMLRSQPWCEVAEFAAYHCQRKALKLRPWKSAPCCGGSDYESSVLLNRLRTAGLSQWEPDPEGALAKFEAKIKGE
jgi:hypothetical protein